MEKKTSVNTQHEELAIDNHFKASDVQDGAQLAIDENQEHELTVKYVLRHHKRLILWTFFWALCSIGW